MYKFFEKQWYEENGLICKILLPLSWVFGLIVMIRKRLYTIGILKSYKLPIPVFIVGNLIVGGSGKTLLVKEIAHILQMRGICIGVIMRGFAGNIKHPHVVTSVDSSDQVGDEALIYATHNIPTAIGVDRYRAGLMLLKKYPNLQLILSDDGLQHYSLQRDYEILIINDLGNKFMLPSGPLREPLSRISTVNAVISSSAHYEHRYEIVLTNINNHDNDITLQQLSNVNALYAMTAIANPNRFFEFLQLHNIEIPLKNRIIFADHYNYVITDIPHDKNAIILTTEKDYVKLRQFVDKRIYVVNIKAKFDDNFINKLTAIYKDLCATY